MLEKNGLCCITIDSNSMMYNANFYDNIPVQLLGIGFAYGNLPVFNQQEAAVDLWNTKLQACGIVDVDCSYKFSPALDSATTSDKL